MGEGRGGGAGGGTERGRISIIRRRRSKRVFIDLARRNSGVILRLPFRRLLPTSPLLRHDSGMIIETFPLVLHDDRRMTLPQDDTRITVPPVGMIIVLQIDGKMEEDTKEEKGKKGKERRAIGYG